MDASGNMETDLCYTQKQLQEEIMPHSQTAPIAPAAVQPATELEIFHDVVTGLLKDPAKLRELVTKAGITTPNGELTAPYRNQ